MGILANAIISSPGQNPIPPGNPDPKRYRIVGHTQHGSHLVAIIVYEGVTNYEGMKIILYLDTSIEELRAAREIDPHFIDIGPLRPFARFEPTDKGWLIAQRLADSLD